MPMIPIAIAPHPDAGEDRLVHRRDPDMRYGEEAMSRRDQFVCAAAAAGARRRTRPSRARSGARHLARRPRGGALDGGGRDAHVAAFCRDAAALLLPTPIFRRACQR